MMSTQEKRIVKKIQRKVIGRTHKCKKLTFVSRLMTFRFGKSLRIETHGIFTRGVFLLKNTPNSSRRSISFKDKRFGRIRKAKRRRIYDCRAKSMKRIK